MRGRATTGLLMVAGIATSNGTIAQAQTSQQQAVIEIIDGTCKKDPQMRIIVAVHKHYAGQNVLVIYGKPDSDDVRVIEQAPKSDKTYKLEGLKPGESMRFAVVVKTQYVPPKGKQREIPEKVLASKKTTLKRAACLIGPLEV